jgi:hypothetical protein
LEFCVAFATWPRYNRAAGKGDLSDYPWEKGIELLISTAHHYVMCMLSRHRGVNVRRFVLAMGVLVAFVAAASTAGALEEQRGALPADVPDAAVKAQVQDQNDSAKSDAGTEIRIPGLGKLGTLPKMDFGLELLYGADDSKPAQEAEPQDNGQQDMLIHGSVKHRF